MRILLLSDLHLESEEEGPDWDPGPMPGFDVLACAGDVVQSDPAACVDVVARIAGGRPAVLVLGNHDAWNHALEDALSMARGRNTGVHVLDGDGVEIDGVRFAGGTLWDDPDDWPTGIPRLGTTGSTTAGEPVRVREGVDSRPATLADLAGEHARTVAAIDAFAADVVLTHYQPSDADLGRVRKEAAWLHGHRHSVLVEHQGRHWVARIPRNKGIDLIGAVIEVRGRNGKPTVFPVVGLGRGPRTG